ncbi:lactosylceramide 4-alpha-galactosyltransferase-like [Euwallacea fornicatus]|uniref:lactosylceramide 4-alpha-galactosyltransferase-like n=1 Tax=Euwallacea fornicatus TaxID=995702 RepID=UPI00338DAA66
MLPRAIRYPKHRIIQLLSLAGSGILSTILLLAMNVPLPSFVINAYYWVNPDKGVFCHYIKTNSKTSLPDISDYIPKEGKSIFFHETSCHSFINGKVTITSRQACAVESAARMNPEHEVYLLYASPGNLVFENTESDRLVKVLLEYSNMNIFHVDMERYFSKTPLEKLYHKGSLKLSKYAQSHTSDLLRYLTLWKYGGIYLDLDVIVIKSLDGLATDFSGVESHRAVAAGIMGFNYTGTGHDFATACLEDLKHNFKGHDWGWNGPGTITRLLKRICNVKTVDEMVKKSSCEGFKVYPPSAFYAIPYWDWKWFFEPQYLEVVEKMTVNSSLIHVWNGFSATTKIPIESTNVPYLEFAKKYCPNVLKQCDKYF